jgi:hypothetical protein
VGETGSVLMQRTDQMSESSENGNRPDKAAISARLSAAERHMLERYFRAACANLIETRDNLRHMEEILKAPVQIVHISGMAADCDTADDVEELELSAFFENWAGH